MLMPACHVPLCRQHRAALAIQCAWRQHQAQVAYRRDRRNIVLVQTAWRSRVARRQLRCLQRLDNRNL